MTKASGNLSLVSISSSKDRETQWNSLWQSGLWLKPVLFTFYLKNKVKKTVRAGRFRKCLKSVLCFLLSVVYDVFVHLQCFVEEIKSYSGVLLLTQIFFVRLFN